MISDTQLDHFWDNLKILLGYITSKSINEVFFSR
jgi:hypothetical protein